jgi:hypothetical protein
LKLPQLSPSSLSLSHLREGLLSLYQSKTVEISTIVPIIP